MWNCFLLQSTWNINGEGGEYTKRAATFYTDKTSGTVDAAYLDNAQLAAEENDFNFILTAKQTTFPTARLRVYFMYMYRGRHAFWDVSTYIFFQKDAAKRVTFTFDKIKNYGYQFF